MTPDDVYLRAIAVQRSLAAPAYVTYVTAYRASGARILCIDGTLHTSFEGHESSASYRVSFRTAGNVAQSVDMATMQRCSGFPLISPNGGEIAELAKPPAPARSESTSHGSLPEIGSVVVRSALHYRVVSATNEMLGDEAVVHLTLQALTDPVTYPLTDLFVDAKTFLVRRIVAMFSDVFGGAPASIAATADFAQEGAYWVQTSEHVELRAPTVPEATRATIDARASDFGFPSDAPEGTATP